MVFRLYVALLLGHVMSHLASILLYSYSWFAPPESNLGITAMAPKAPAPVMESQPETEIGTMAMGDEDVPTFSTTTNTIYL